MSSIYLRVKSSPSPPKAPPKKALDDRSSLRQHACMNAKREINKGVVMTRTKKNCILTLVLVFSVLCCGELLGKDFYVDANGDDTNDGSKDAPFATIDRARQAVREHKKQKGFPAGGFNVWLREGVFELEESLVFDFHDSGTADWPIVYSAYPGEHVSIRGGVDIDPKHFTPIKDDAVRERIVEQDIVDHIVQLDLKALGITNLGEMSARGFRRPYVNPGLEIFVNHEAMRISQWPNDDVITLGEVLDRGSVPRQGDFENRGGKFKFDFDRASYWTQADDFYIGGRIGKPWADDTIKVDDLDVEAKTIRLAYAHMYGVDRGWYYVTNLLEEINRPGEYFIDRNTGILYLYPPEDLDDAQISVSLMDEPLIVLEDASHIHFENLTIELTRGIGVYIEGGEGNLVAGCTLRNIGQVAVVMGKGIKPDTKNRHDFTGEPMSRQLGSWHTHFYQNTTFYRNAGRNHGVLSCDIYNIGAGAISMSGGNRLTMQPGGNFVENCQIYRFNRLDRSYKAAVNIDGVGNRIAHNHIFDAPDIAIYLHGNDHLIEYNHIHDVMLENGDGGWFYMGRDISELGNVVRYNFAHHVGVSEERPDDPRTRGSAGIYMDDVAAGLTIFGNILYKTGRSRGAIMLDRVSDTKVMNNILIECQLGITERAWHPESNRHWNRINPQILEDSYGPESLRAKRLFDVNYLAPPFIDHYPFVQDFLDFDVAWKPRRNVTANNVFVDMEEKDALHRAKGGNLGEKDNLIIQKDPGFVDRENLNFKLTPDSVVYEKLPGFKRTPFEKIGLYVDQYRQQAVSPFAGPH